MKITKVVAEDRKNVDNLVGRASKIPAIIKIQINRLLSQDPKILFNILEIEVSLLLL